MKLISICLFIFISNAVIATDILSLKKLDDLVFTGVTTASFTLGSDDPSGDAHSDTTPATVYVPMEGLTNATLTNKPFFSLFHAGVTNLFDYIVASSSVNYIVLPLKATVGSTNKYVHVAVKSGTSYVVAKNSSSPLINISNSEFTFNITPSELCKQINVGSGSTDICANLTTTSTTATNQEIMAYVFLSSSVKSLGSTDVTPDIYGTYIKFKLSNRIYPVADIMISLTDLRKGDKRLVGTYSASATMDSNVFKKILVFNHSAGSSTTADLPTSSYLGNYFEQDLSTTQAGEFTISGLVNGLATPYTISVSFMDKYKFATALSNQKSGTPTEIEELLKKQSCFLLTAGFGEEHFVIDYFRKFRDTKLSHNYLGKVFIKYYYKYAPSFALSIYNNEMIRFVLRVVGYTGYYLFNYIIWVLLILMLPLGLFVKKKFNFSKI